MSRRSKAAILVIAAVCIAPIATAADLKSNIHAAAEHPLSGAIARIFARSADADHVQQSADGMLMAEPAMPHVIVATVKANGEAVAGCVDHERAAINFLRKAERPATGDNSSREQ